MEVNKRECVLLKLFNEGRISVNLNDGSKDYSGVEDEIKEMFRYVNKQLDGEDGDEFFEVELSQTDEGVIGLYQKGLIYFTPNENYLREMEFGHGN